MPNNTRVKVRSYAFIKFPRPWYSGGGLGRGPVSDGTTTARITAFTMIELIVVVGIIAILAGLLLPAVNHMRVAAQITGQKADFQTISAALEQYKADFGDYPRNTVLPTWNVYQTGPNGPTNTPAPIYLTLASALIGPGPLSTQTIQISPNVEVYELGDGADGLGFAAQSVNIGFNTGNPAYAVSSVNFTTPRTQ